MKPAEKDDFFKEGKSLDKSGMFIVETANQRIARAKELPNPRQMVGNFWKESELMVLFAYTGTGKTMFAMQIARAISEGKSVFNELPNECEAKKVLFYDAELSDKQFQNRSSSNYKNEYQYSDNYFYATIDREYNLKKGESFSESIIPLLESMVVNNEIEVLIIDNLHCLQESLENSKDAKPLMDSLVGIKRRYNVSLMIVGHTPKQTLFKEMDLKDLQGSAALSVQLDTCVAIGNSIINDKTKYFKEVKMRDGMYLFGRDNVITVELQEMGNLTEFKFIDTESEINHLEEVDANKIIDTVLELRKDGNTIREIKEKTGISRGKVHNIVQAHKDVDKVVQNDKTDKVDKMDKQTTLYGT